MSQINYEIVLELIKKNNHIRGLAKALNTNQTTIARKMQELEQQNLVDYVYEGKNKVYFLKNNLETKEYKKIIEHYKLLEIIKKQPRLRKIVEKIKSNPDIKLAILFGSYAKHTQQESSDIDIYVETKNKQIKKEIELQDSKINVKTGDFNKESLLTKEIIKNHIILKGVDRYYELIY
ncbi:nucleotidyltransferase domain-containing protein [Candidatus Woesearchaeota archaeon]|nr:nucleotidyltransferase domain-containing protein [Candidatus Woesearchaeota archaeon]